MKNSLGVQRSIGTSFHESAPRLGREPERVMYDKLKQNDGWSEGNHPGSPKETCTHLPVVCLPLHDQVRIPVKPLEEMQRRQLPRLVHGLYPKHRGMAGVHLDNRLDDPQRMFDVRAVDGSVFEGDRIKVSNPVGL